jgi:uncharacterized protein (TIGR03083 family)
VRDCVAHIIGVERDLLGEPVPEHQLPADLVHVRTEFQRYTEVPVDLRRDRGPRELVAELREVVDRRLAMLRADESDPDEPARGPIGYKLTYLQLLNMRVFDIWAHEQDIRRAVGRPGNLDGPAAELSRDWLLPALPRVVAKAAGAPPGSAVVFEVTGPVAFTVAVTVNDAGRGALQAETPATPTVTLAMDWETFIRLACGRVRPEAVAVKVEGDQALAQRILAAMALTP